MIPDLGYKEAVEELIELKKSKFLIVNQEEAIDMAIEYMSNDIKDRLLVKTLEKL